MWNVTPSDRWNWKQLKDEIKKYGVRNSLLVSPMPTASTAQILNNNESFEPIHSNIYTRRVLAGEFIRVNKQLIDDLIELNLWNADMRNKLINENGSIQNIPNIPQKLKDIYKTVWEIQMKTYIDMASDRGELLRTQILLI